MTAPVVGSSGGVYALVSAHLANIVMVSTPLLWPFSASPLLSLGLGVNVLEPGFGSMLLTGLGEDQAAEFREAPHPLLAHFQWGPCTCDLYFL